MIMVRMPRLFRLFAPAAVALLAAASPSAALETAAPEAIVVDFDTGAVLYEKNADEKVGPASMAKMMTVYLLFERLQDGRMSLEDKLTVSEDVWRRWYKSEGSKMFLEVGKEVRVEDLIRGIVVQSGNDASDVVAEAIAGSEEAFAREMNRKARELGMPNTLFQNSSGWPAPDQYTTVRDLAKLVEATIRKFPNFYHYYAEKNFTFNGIKQGNRNPLLYKDVGVDGLKTGHTLESGFGLAASAERDGRRVIVVAHGMESMRARGEQVERLIDWAFREWNHVAMFESGEIVAEIPVWLGDQDVVPVVAMDDVKVAVPLKSMRRMTVSVVHQKAVPAPIARGDQIATLVVSAPDMKPVEVPLYAGADVGERSFFGRIGPAIKSLVLGSAG